MIAPGVASVALTDLDRAGLAGVGAIYAEAFPARQRMPFAEIAASAAAGERLVLVALDDAGPVGFGTVLPFRDLASGYVEYFAIRNGERGRGLGSALWRTLLDRASAERDVAAVVFEVEDPADADNAEEGAERVRRIRFYERLGAQRLPVPDFRAVNLDDTGTEPMHLLWQPTRAAVSSPGDVGALVRAVYVEGYELAPDDPVVVSALASTGG